MRFAEEHPDKIAAWRRGASLRAFLPRVDYDYEWRDINDITLRDRMETSADTSVQTDSGVEWRDEDKFNREYQETERTDRDDISWRLTERWSNRGDTGWSKSVRTRDDTGYRTTVDDQDRSSRDNRWRIRLAWDLRDFLYSSAQTRISVEARRLVELRQDVLQEINTYFFDRRRAQIELLFAPPDDIRSKIDLQLQVARITASIDALTGGYLSGVLKKAQPDG